MVLVFCETKSIRVRVLTARTLIYCGTPHLDLDESPRFGYCRACNLS
jgi:hypothetical protein